MAGGSPFRQPTHDTEQRSKKQRTHAHSRFEDDFKIISSDGKEFCIDRCHLCSCSSVFRDMLSVGVGPPEITLIDTDIETSDIVEGFIILVTQHRLPWFESYHTPDVQQTIKLIRFLEKYDCQSSLYLIRLHMERSLMRREPHAGIEYFIVGAVLDQPDLCSMALRLEYTARWDPSVGDEGNLTDSKSRGRAFNPQHMPLDYWHLIPSDYLWALNRAWDASGKDQASAHVCFDEFIEAAKAAPNNRRRADYSESNTDGLSGA